MTSMTLLTPAMRMCHIWKLFVSKTIKSPLKQMSISQAISAAARTRSLMPLQSGLAVATDNRLASKWLNTTLSRLGI